LDAHLILALSVKGKKVPIVVTDSKERVDYVITGTSHVGSVLPHDRVKDSDLYQ
jgi:hypothetical protein